MTTPSRDEQLRAVANDLHKRLQRLFARLEWDEARTCLMALARWVVEAEESFPHAETMELGFGDAQVFEARHGRLELLQKSVTRAHESFAAACHAKNFEPSYAEAHLVVAMQLKALAEDQILGERQTQGESESPEEPAAAARPRQR